MWQLVDAKVLINITTLLLYISNPKHFNIRPLSDWIFRYLQLKTITADSRLKTLWQKLVWSSHLCTWNVDHFNILNQSANYFKYILITFKAVAFTAILAGWCALHNLCEGLKKQFLLIFRSSCKCYKFTKTHALFVASDNFQIRIYRTDECLRDYPNMVLRFVAGKWNSFCAQDVLKVLIDRSFFYSFVSFHTRTLLIFLV